MRLSMKVAKANQRPCWYRIHIVECPLCGRSDEDRERVYGKRPADDADRYEYANAFCPEHFA